MGSSTVNLQARGQVVADANPLPVTPGLPVATTAGFSAYRNTALAATKSEIKSTLGNIYGLKVTNPNTVPVYVKFYNGPAAGVTVGTTTPQNVVTVPPGDGATPGLVWLPPGQVPAMSFDTGITTVALTDLADAGTSAPASALYAEVTYK